MHFFYWLTTARQCSLGSLHKLTEFPDKAVHAVVLRSEQGGSHRILPKPSAAPPGTRRSREDHPRHAELPLPVPSPPGGGTGGDWGAASQQSEDGGEPSFCPKNEATPATRPHLRVSSSTGGAQQHNLGLGSWEPPGSASRRAQLSEGGFGTPPDPRSPCSRSLKPPAAPSPGGGLTSHPAFPIQRSGARLASELFPPPYFQKAAPCPNTFPAGSPPPPRRPSPPQNFTGTSRDVSGGGSPTPPRARPRSVPAAPRTYRPAGCASRSRSQCHARPPRAAPPAPGVSSSPGLPLPAGDMARGGGGGRDTSGAGAGRAERGARRREGGDGGGGDANAAAGGLPALRGGTCESARWRRAVV